MQVTISTTQITLRLSLDWCMCIVAHVAVRPTNDEPRLEKPTFLLSVHSQAGTRSNMGTTHKSEQWVPQHVCFPPSWHGMHCLHHLVQPPLATLQQSCRPARPCGRTGGERMVGHGSFVCQAQIQNLCTPGWRWGMANDASKSDAVATIATTTPRCTGKNCSQQRQLLSPL